MTRSRKQLACTCRRLLDYALEAGQTLGIGAQVGVCKGKRRAKTPGDAMRNPASWKPEIVTPLLCVSLQQCGGTGHRAPAPRDSDVMLKIALMPVTSITLMTLNTSDRTLPLSAPRRSSWTRKRPGEGEAQVLGWERCQDRRTSPEHAWEEASSSA